MDAFQGSAQISDTFYTAIEKRTVFQCIGNQAVEKSSTTNKKRMRDVLNVVRKQ